VPQLIVPENFRDVRHAHRRAGVTGVGFLDRVHGEGAYGVGKLSAGRHEDLLA
jgi:hypothetical protein